MLHTSYRPLLLLLTLCPPSFAGLLWLHTADLSIAVNTSTGAVQRLNTSLGFTSGPSFTAGIFAGEDLSPVVHSVAVAACSHNGAPAVCVDSNVTVLGERSNATCCERYPLRVRQTLWGVALPGVPTAVGWTATFLSAAPLPWRTVLQARVDYFDAANAAAAADARVWAPQGGLDSENRAFRWRDVLSPVAAADGVDLTGMQYGKGFLCDPGTRPPCMGRLLPIPLSYSASAAAGAGLGVVAALDDDIFGLVLDLTPASAAFSRRFNRLASAAGPVSATHFLVPAGNDWRGIFKWGRRAFPRFFLSPTLLTPAARAFSAARAHAGEVAALGRRRAAAAAAPPPPPPPRAIATGLALYSCADVADLNLTELALSGANVNWDAHFYWPYIGMYLPPIVPANASWESNVGDGEEGACGRFKHGQQVSYSGIAAEYTAAAEAGIQTLAYFNLNEWGQNFACEPLPPQRPPPPNDWRNSTQFLANHFPAAPLPGCVNTGWQNGVVLDSTDPGFAAYLLSQVQLKLDVFGGALQGLAFDRFDHVSQWRHGLAPAIDDGRAWCGDPCYPLLTGFVALLGEIGALLWRSPAPAAGPRLSTANYVGSLRVDTLQHSDGVFSEDYDAHLALVYAAGISTTGKPPNMLWTYSVEEVLNYQPNPDAYFAQHVAHKAFPFAPALGNDHSILPNASTPIQELYSSWGPLFTALRGGCWWLADRPVAVAWGGGGAGSARGARALQANAFTVGGGCTAPGVDGGNGPVGALLAFAFADDFETREGDAAVLSLAQPLPFADPSRGPSACEARTPGAGGAGWVSVPLPTSSGGRWEFGALGMSRGAVLLRCVQ